MVGKSLSISALKSPTACIVHKPRNPRIIQVREKTP